MEQRVRSRELRPDETGLRGTWLRRMPRSASDPEFLLDFRPRTRLRS